MATTKGTIKFEGYKLHGSYKIKGLRNKRGKYMKKLRDAELRKARIKKERLERLAESKQSYN